MPRTRISTLELFLAGCLAPLAAAGWLALATAHAGRLSPILAGFAAFVALTCVLAFALEAARQGQLDVSGWDFLALAAGLTLIWAARPTAEPWPVYLDASWYFNTATQIAEAAALRFEPEGLSELETPELRRLVTASFSDQRAAGLPFPADEDRGFFGQAFTIDDLSSTSVGPYHPPFFAASLALMIRPEADSRTGSIVLAWALAWLLAVATLARLAFGARAGPLALILAGTGPLFSYYGGQPYAELAAGALLLAGLAALMRLSESPAPAPLAAASLGLCLGLAGLLKLDVLPAIAIALACWGLTRARQAGRRENLALIIGLALPLGHGVLLGLTVSRLYYRLNVGGVWQLLVARAGAIGVMILALLALALVARLVWKGRPKGRRPGLPSQGRWLGLALVLTLALASAQDWLTPETAAPSMLAILSWAATPLGLWAAATGLVLALEQPVPRRQPLLVLALTALPLVLVAPVVTRSLSSLYAARRLLPLAWPLLAVFAAGAAVLLLEARPGEALSGIGGPRRRAGITLSALMLVLWASHLEAQPLSHAGGRDFAGGRALAADLVRQVRPDDILLFSSTLDGSDAGRLAAAVWALEGRPVAVLGAAQPEPERLVELVRVWRAAGRDVYLVGDARQAPPDFGSLALSEQSRVAIVSQAPARDPALPPRMAPLPIELLVYQIETEAVAP